MKLCFKQGFPVHLVKPPYLKRRVLDDLGLCKFAFYGSPGVMFIADCHDLVSGMTMFWPCLEGGFNWTNWGGKPHLEHGYYGSMGWGPEVNNREKWISTSLLHLDGTYKYVDISCFWCLLHHDELVLFLHSVSYSKPLLLSVARYFCHSNGLSHSSLIYALETSAVLWQCLCINI